MERVKTYCRDCEEYDPAPSGWITTPFGWCRECWEYVEGCEESCDMFDPTRRFLDHIRDLEYIREDFIRE